MPIRLKLHFLKMPFFFFLVLQLIFFLAYSWWTQTSTLHRRSGHRTYSVRISEKVKRDFVPVLMVSSRLAQRKPGIEQNNSPSMSTTWIGLSSRGADLSRRRESIPNRCQQGPCVRAPGAPPAVTSRWRPFSGIRFPPFPAPKPTFKNTLPHWVLSPKICIWLLNVHSWHFSWNFLVKM